MKDSVAEFFEKFGDDEQILKLALIDRAPRKKNDPDDDGPEISTSRISSSSRSK